MFSDLRACTKTVVLRRDEFELFTRVNVLATGHHFTNDAVE